MRPKKHCFGDSTTVLIRSKMNSVRGYSYMTVETRKKIVTLSRSIVRNTPRVSKKLSTAGVKVNGNIVLSLAKYYRALEKLAKK